MVLAYLTLSEANNDIEGAQDKPFGEVQHSVLHPKVASHEAQHADENHLFWKK